MINILTFWFLKDCLRYSNELKEVYHLVTGRYHVPLRGNNPLKKS